MEENLILADLGAATAMEAVEQLREKVKREHLKEPGAVREALREILAQMLQVGDSQLQPGDQTICNSDDWRQWCGQDHHHWKTGRTTAPAGKESPVVCSRYLPGGCGRQLEVWAGRANAEIIRQDEGADPASVVFDAISAAKARGADVILCDTAGRLHNKQNLMNELSKISRIIDRELPGCDKEVLLVLDGTTGQNGLAQAREFQQAAGLTGIVLTKLDGTAKGGIVIAVARELQVPVKFVGVGEQMDDLMAFDAASFTQALL